MGNCRLLILLLVMMSPMDSSAVDDLANADLADIDRQLNNPLTSIWSLTFQNNTELKTGNDIDGKEHTNNFFFQPFLAFEVGSQKQHMLTLRPVFPLVKQVVADAYIELLF